jgi:hypothetical protein
MSRGSLEDKIRNMFYAMNMSTGRSKCVSNRLSGILPPLHIQNTPQTVSTPTARGRDTVPTTTASNLRHRRASTGTSILLVRSHSRSVSPKSMRPQSIGSATWLETNSAPQSDNLLHWLADVLRDDNGVKISHDALLDVHAAFQRAYITTVSALIAIPESDMTYSELKSLGIGPIGVRTMILSAHKKLLMSRNQPWAFPSSPPSLASSSSTPKAGGGGAGGERRRASENSVSCPVTPSAASTRSAASQLFSAASSISDSPEHAITRIASPSLAPVTPSIPPPQVKIIGNRVYVAVSKPLGMNLAENVPDEPLGVHIEKIVPDGNAASCGILRAGFVLREVCGKDAMEMEFDDIMDILREAPFDTPLKMIFLDPTKTEEGEEIPEEGGPSEEQERDDGEGGDDGHGEEDEEEGRGEEEDTERRSFSFEDLEEERASIEDGPPPGGPRLLLRRKSSMT